MQNKNVTCRFPGLQNTNMNENHKKPLEMSLFIMVL